MTENRTYDLSAEVTFTVVEGVDLMYWMDPESGEKKHRMDGIYSHVRTEDELYAHLAYNAIFNGVYDASQLEGWGDLERDQITIQVDGRIE